MKKLDVYIITKFLGTFFFAIVLILSVAIVFDITEHMDDFFETQVSMKTIILEYYLPFIPYYMNMFSQLFIFISVIFFTSKLAGDSEIIAILACGVSYQRLLIPYMACATFLFFFCFALGGYVIPKGNAKMLNFMDVYVHKFTKENAHNIQMMVDPNTVFYIESFQKTKNMGYRSSLERFDGKTLCERIIADRIFYDSLYNWHFESYTKRTFDGMHETLTRGGRLDTTIHIVPDELFVTQEQAQQMTNTELRSYIRTQKERGSGGIEPFETEWWKRFASPVGAFIMTLLGFTLSSKKQRGGMGKSLGIGIVLSALYILFSTMSTSFSVGGLMTPFMAVWLPNFVFLIISIYLYIRVSR